MSRRSSLSMIPSNLDDLNSALDRLKEFAIIRQPDECEQPILTGDIQQQINEWLGELNATDDLAYVKCDARRSCMLFGPPGGGKAQPLDAKVKGLTGWHRIGDLAVGDRIASVDGKDSTVMGVYPQGKLKVWTVVFSDETSVECGADHLWTVTHKDWLSSRTMATKDIQAAITKPTNTGRLYVPLVSGDFGVDDDLLMDPYLLGLLLGDGCFVSGGCVYYSAGDDEVLQRFKSALPPTREVRHNYAYDWRIIKSAAARGGSGEGNRASDVRNCINALGLGDKKSIDKFIPSQYLLASKESRIALLRGLLDSDGYAEPSNKLCYATSSPRLRDDVASLARSLGAVVSICNKFPFHTYKGERRQGSDSWVLFFHNPFGRELATLQRHINKWTGEPRQSMGRRTIKAVIESDREEEMVCIKVSHPTETYITNDYIVTHNTTLAHHIAARRGVPLVCVQSQHIASPYLSEGGRNVTKLFDQLTRAAGADGLGIVTLFDEFDSIAVKRASRSSADNERTMTLNAFLVRIEKFTGVTLAATNRNEEIDSAIWRRFGMQIQIGLPGYDERYAILAQYAAPFILDPAALDILAQVTSLSNPDTLKKLMHGMKRALVLWPRRGMAINKPADVFRIASASIVPPMDMDTPPLWDHGGSRTRCLDQLANIPWPPAFDESLAGPKPPGEK